MRKQSRRPGDVILRSRPGIPADVREAVKSLARWLRATQRVPHRLIVQSVAEPAIRAGEAVAFGCFQWPAGTARYEGRYVWLYVAAGMVEVMERDHGDTREQAIDALLHTILHEFAHYEQWRDGGEPRERGVNRRATRLLRDFRASLSHADPEVPRG